MKKLQILQGSALEKLKELDDKSIQTCITSPPYWGLRNYNVEGQLGLESTPQQYVQKLVEIFREVKRVLKDDGTVWLNLGDSYAGTRPMGTSDNEIDAYGRVNKTLQHTTSQGKLVKGLKPKDLVGIPWRVAFALQEDGWYLRQDIIWNKPNPMPESVTDRCTKSHEYIFLLSKSERYYYENELIKEPTVQVGAKNVIGGTKYPGKYQNIGKSGNQYEDLGTKNKRSVWNMTTKPYKEAHFATFPEVLPETCIRASCSLGNCSNCGKPLKLEKERDKHPTRDMEAQRQASKEKTGRTDGHISGPSGQVDKVRTLGYIADCDCDPSDRDFITPTVLDPFAGAGTTGLVAMKLGKAAVLIELNPEYVELIHKRLNSFQQYLI